VDAADLALRVDDRSIKAPAFVSSLTPQLQDHVEGILDATMGLSASLREQGVWEGEMDMLGGLIEGNSRRVRLYIKPWPDRVVYSEVNALLSGLLRRDENMLVRASVEVKSVTTGKFAPEPALYIELCDSPARAGARAPDAAVSYQRNSKPELLPADNDVLAVLQVRRDAARSSRCRTLTQPALLLSMRARPARRR
jgi:hypothetical protein